MQNKPITSVKQKVPLGRGGLPWWLSGKESTCQCSRLGFDPQDIQSLLIDSEKETATIPVFLPREFQGHRRLADYSPWGCKELDTIEILLKKIVHLYYKNHL